MGDLFPIKYRLGKVLGAGASTLLFGVVAFTCLSVGVEAYGYMPGFCYCDLDKHLVDVRKAVVTGKDPPPIPETPVTTTTVPSAAESSTSGSADDTTGDSATSESDNGDTNSAGGTNSESTGGSDSDSTASSPDSTNSDQTTADSDQAGDSSDQTNSDQSTDANDQAGDSSDQTTDANDQAGDSSDQTNSDQTGTSNSQTTDADDSQTTAAGNSQTAAEDNSQTAAEDNSQTTAAVDEQTTENTDSNSTVASDDATTGADSQADSPTAATEGGTGNGNGNGNGKGNGNGNGNNEEDPVTQSATTAATTGEETLEKRDVSNDEYYLYLNKFNDAKTLMETPRDDDELVGENVVSPSSRRMKREALDLGTTLISQKDPLFSFVTQQMEYSGLKTSSDLGVVYDKDFNAKNCSCEDGSIVSVSICLLDLKYDNGLANAKSDIHKKVSNEIMFPLTGALYKGLVGVGGVRYFRRAAMKSFKKRGDGSTDAIFEVTLTDLLYQAEYHVLNALEPSIRMSRIIGPYKTDNEECISTTDVTPPEPVVRSPMWWLRYICLPIALGVIALMIILTCTGQRDAYQMLMW